MIGVSYKNKFCPPRGYRCYSMPSSLSPPQHNSFIIWNFKTTYITMKIWDSTDFSLLWTIIPKDTHHHLASIRTYSRKAKVTEVFRADRHKPPTTL